MIGFLKKKGIRKQNRGFTLVELLVVIVIFVVLTSIVLFSQDDFNNSVLLNNLGYDIALTIRQAQDYGLNTNESQVANTFSSYGAYFNLTSSNTNYVFFADTNNDGKYNNAQVTYCPANDAECVQKYTLTNGNYIKSICVVTSGTCNLISSDLTVLFAHPNPDAIIYADGGNTPFNQAQITIAAPSGASKTIVVTSVGQIYLQ